jgi:hypothetical protein
VVFVSTSHQSTADGAPIDDDMVEAMADKADQRDDVAEILGRRRGSPTHGFCGFLGRAGCASIRSSRETDLAPHRGEGTSASEIIGRAIGSTCGSADAINLIVLGRVCALTLCPTGSG